jgi:hypothetical protein
MFIETLPDDAFVVLVTGDRNWTDLLTVATRLSQLPSNPVIVHGWAVGLDTVVDVVAHELGFRVIRCPAHWRHNEKKCVEVWGVCDVDCKEIVGRAAGAIRNHFMFDKYHPKIVLGWHDNIQESKGTKEMLTYAQKRGAETWLYSTHSEPIQNPPLTKRAKSGKILPMLPESLFDFNES